MNSFITSVVRTAAAFVQRQPDTPIFHVDAIFASNDVEATQILPLVSKMPSKPLVIGFDGTQLIQAIFPNMPTIVQPINQLADIAIEVLEKRIAGEAIKTKYLLDVTLSTHR